MYIKQIARFCQAFLPAPSMKKNAIWSQMVSAEQHRSSSKHKMADECSYVCVSNNLFTYFIFICIFCKATQKPNWNKDVEQWNE